MNGEVGLVEDTFQAPPLCTQNLPIADMLPKSGGWFRRGHHRTADHRSAERAEEGTRAAAIISSSLVIFYFSPAFRIQKKKAHTLRKNKKGQTTEVGIPPPFRATVWYSRKHPGF